MDGIAKTDHERGLPNRLETGMTNKFFRIVFHEVSSLAQQFWQHLHDGLSCHVEHDQENAPTSIEQE